MVLLEHEGGERQGRRYVQIGKVGEEPEEVTPVVGQVVLVGLVVILTGFLDGFFFLMSQTLLLAAAAAGKGVRSGRV